MELNALLNTTLKGESEAARDRRKYYAKAKRQALKQNIKIEIDNYRGSRGYWLSDPGELEAAAEPLYMDIFCTSWQEVYQTLKRLEL